MFQFCSVSNSFSHTTLLNKVRGIFFLKDCLVVIIVSLWFCMHASTYEYTTTLLFTHNWRGNNWIHTFPKGINVMWNAISLVQVLNSCHRVHFPTTIAITARAPPFSISHFLGLKYQTVLFEPLIGRYQVLLLRLRVDLGAMVMEGYSAFLKTSALLKPHRQSVCCHIQDTHWVGCVIVLQRCNRCILQPQPIGFLYLALNQTKHVLVNISFRKKLRWQLLYFWVRFNKYLKWWRPLRS